MTKTTRVEYLDRLLFFNTTDLQNKLDAFQQYYNKIRSHSSLEKKPPFEIATPAKEDNKVRLTLIYYGLRS